MKILIAEDDPSLARALKTILQREKYATDVVSNGSDALDFLTLGAYDAAVLDVMMPGMDGFSVLRAFREKGGKTPVLFLTAKSEIEDRVTGLDLGAEDYLTKPFDLRELLARLRALVRRTGTEKSAVIQRGNTSLDTVSFLLKAEKGETFLANKEYQCLYDLMQNPGRVFSAEAFLERIWDVDDPGRENALWTVIYNLRKKLKDLGSDQSIRTRRGQGYVLEEDR